MAGSILEPDSITCFRNVEIRVILTAASAIFTRAKVTIGGAVTTLVSYERALSAGFARQAC